jgi:hypothetical protein
MKIEISKGCFDEDVRIDGVSIFKRESDTRTNDELDNAQQSLIDELSKIKSSLNIQDWVEIADILTGRSREFEYDVENSHDTDQCDQCGDYNWNHIYTKIEDVNEENNTK